MNNLIRILVVTLALSPAAAWANSSLGLLAGVANLNNSGGSPVTYGLAYDYGINNDWRIGVQANTMNPSSVTVGSSSYTQTLTNIDFAIKYTFSSWQFGALVGNSMASSNVPGSSSSSGTNYGALIAYDWVMGSWSAGAQVDNLWSTVSNGFTVTDAELTLKYWF